MTMIKDGMDRWHWARERLQISCVHACNNHFVHALDNHNSIHYQRLFFIPKASPKGSCVEDLENGQILKLEPGSISFLPAHAHYRFCFVAGFKISAFHFRLHSVNDIDVLDGHVLMHQHMDKNMAQRLWSVLDCRTPAQWLQAEAILRQAVSELIDVDWQTVQEQVRHAGEWSAVLEALNQADAAGPQVQVLAAAFGLSRERFSRRFRDHFNCTIRDWHKRQLSARIREHLWKYNETLEVVAPQFGFSDAFALSRFMKRATGLSPKQIRQQGALGY